jgi:4'-phosphopantetheinyl transferase
MQWMVRGEAGIPPGTGWLTPKEAARAAGMRFTKRRTEYLLRRWTGKCGVAAVVGMGQGQDELAQIAVLNRPTGAPYVEVAGRPLGMDISLTDRAGWAICLIGADLGRVGVDLEIAEPRSAGFVRDFLTASEQDFVAAQQRDSRTGLDPGAAANLIWSAKEAALKVLRTGLRADTRTVEVRVAEPGATGWGELHVQRIRELPVVPARYAHLVDPEPAAEQMVGWWRRDGVFLTTMVAPAPFTAPDPLPGSWDLTDAVPIHSWMAKPLVDG